MPKFIIAIFVLAFSLSVFGQKTKENYVRDEILVKLSASTTKQLADNIYSRHNLQFLEDLGDTGWKRVRLLTGSDAKRASTSVARDKEILSAQPNFYYQLQATPNDPMWTSSAMYGLPKISAPQAWDLSTGSSSVVVANIDTGMRYTHEDLAANMWVNTGEINGNGIDDDGNGFADDYYGYDFFFSDPDPLDQHGHGTHTGGTIGARGNNALGVTGVNWDVRIMAIKIYNQSGFGSTSAMLINAYNYIRMMKNRGVNIRVTNNSYAGCDEACGYDQATKDALDLMGDADILNVFAAGNNAWNNDSTAAPAYPAAYTSPSILTVASTTNTDTRSSFSNWGAVSIDLAAPGSSILSTTNGSNSSYGNSSGTSMAAPHVAGAAALLAAYRPTLSAASLKATLMNTVDPLTTWGSTPIKTNGRLNVFNALQNPTVCTPSLSANQVNVGTKGGYVTVNVTGPANCEYRLRSNTNWVVLDTKEIPASGTIRFWVRTNNVIQRTAQIQVGGSVITVNQRR